MLGDIPMSDLKKNSITKMAFGLLGFHDSGPLGFWNFQTCELLGILASGLYGLWILGLFEDNFMKQIY